MDPPLPLVRLSVLAEAVEGEVRGDHHDVSIRDAGYDSRAVAPGSLFFCVPGEHTDGHEHAAEAVSRGASGLVVERWLPVETPQVRVRSVREAMGPVSRLVFGAPADAMTVVQITGTNGKTTVTYLLESVFRAAGWRPGVVGTTGARIDGAPEPLARTTPEAPDLHRLMAKMRSEGVQAVAMEASSHALEQRRTDGIVADVAVFMNLSQDHLDYHGTMQEYFASKRLLFEPARARIGLVNAGDPWGRELLASPAIPLRTFAVDADADLRAHDVRVDGTGISFRAAGLTIRSPLRGVFNVENCLAALAVAVALGIDGERAAAAIEQTGQVPGRMEPIDTGQEFLVVVDYAHTPDSILSVLRGARPLATGRVIVVFGCGGDRDRTKRRSMGEAATSSADLTIITSDNPRSEDPLAIIGEVVPGADAGGGPYVVEPDRRAAIEVAVREARAGDVVVIAGKGHEAGQEAAGVVYPFDDREVAREALLALRGSR